MILVDLTTVDSIEILIRYSAFIVALSFVLGFTANAARKSKTRALMWFFFFIMSSIAFSTFELFVILTGDPILKRFTYSTGVCIWLICWTAFFKDSTRAHVSPVFVAFIITLTAVLHLMAWLFTPEILEIETFIGIFIIPVLLSSMFIYWSIITYIDSPWFARKAGLLLLISSIDLMLFNLLAEFLPSWMLIGLVIVFSTLLAGVIFRHPGIVSFLPYKARYLVLLDKHNEVMFEQVWSKRKGERPADFEAERKNIVSLLQHFRTLEKWDQVGAKGIDLEIGSSIFLINSGSSRFIAGLITKRSSKALRDGLSLFARQVDEILANTPQEDANTVTEQIMAILKERMLSINAIA